MESFRKKTFVLGDAILFSSLANLFLGIPEGLHIVKEILNTRGVAYTSDAFWSRMVEKKAVKMWAAAGLEERLMSAAICFVSGDLWPLMVDPDCLMERGISKLFSDSDSGSDPVTISASDDSFAKILKEAVSNGKTLLVKNFERVPLRLVCKLLEQGRRRRGKYLEVRIGDSLVQLHAEFKLYAFTRAKKNIPREVLDRVLTIQCSTSTKEIEKRLKGIATQVYHRDVADETKELKKEIIASEIKVGVLRESVLEMLSSSTGKILEDDKTLEMLKETQTASSELEKQRQELERRLQKKGEALQAYNSLAKRLTILFEVRNENFIPTELGWYENKVRDVLLKLKGSLKFPFSSILDCSFSSSKAKTFFANLLDAATARALSWTRAALCVKQKKEYLFLVSLHILDISDEERKIFIEGGEIAQILPSWEQFEIKFGKRFPKGPLILRFQGD